MVETIYPDATPETQADNTRTRTEYDVAGRRTAEIDQMGRVTRFVYDKVGRLIETIAPDATPDTDADNPITRTEYYTDGMVKAQIDERGNRTEFRYDADGRQVKVIYADATPADLTDNPYTQYVYDDAGQQTAVTDALNHTTRYVYDDLGRLTQTIFQDQTVTTSEYDTLGRRVALVDQEGHRTEYRYDALGRLTGVKDAHNQWTEYGYDELGHLLWQEDANDHRTRYEYDDLGRRTATVLTLGQRSTATYDAVGNVKSVTDFNGNTSTYTYDEQNRVKRKSFPVDGTFFEYDYTLTGQVKTITSVRGIRSFTYDERDRMITRRDNAGPYTEEGDTIKYSYDAAGNRTSVETASGATLYSFDERNHLKTVTDADQDVTTYIYDDVSNLIQTQFANGVTEIREYDTLNRLDLLKNIKQDATTGQEIILTLYDYVLDEAGQRKSVIDHTGRKVEYSYDELYRLTQEQVTANGSITVSIDYSFDHVGNRLSKVETVSGATTTTTYQYDQNDRLEWEKLNDILSTSYQYDNNGSTIQKTEGDQTTLYRWNQEKRLVGVTTADGKTISYVYDCQGDRQSATVDGVTTRYIVDKNLPYTQVLEEWTGGNLAVSYVYGNDLISQERNGVRSTYLVDGLGSTTALTDASGNITNQYVYDAYGNLSETVGTTQNNYLFAGEQWDSNVGEYYLRQRYYQPETGRFARRDTYEGKQDKPLTLHKYLYAHANPITNVDPSGLLVTEQATATKILGDLLATSYVLYSARNSVVGITGISGQQKDAVARAGRPHLIPLLKSDQQGCFSTDYQRQQPFEEWALYEKQVSESNMNFLAVSPRGIVGDYDGLTPNTRNVWEAKHDYGWLLNSSPVWTEAQLGTHVDWLNQRSRQLLVAGECGYRLTWAFSNPYVADFARDELLGEPPPMVYKPFWGDIMPFI